MDTKKEFDESKKFYGKLEKLIYQKLITGNTPEDISMISSNIVKHIEFLTKIAISENQRRE